MQTQWVDRVRQLLARANDQHRAAFTNLDALKSSIDAALEAARLARRGEPHPVPYPIRRKHLMVQIGLKARYYGLSDEVQAFVYAAGVAVLQQLDIEQLAALDGWLARWIENMENACDSELSPPAR